MTSLVLFHNIAAVPPATERSTRENVKPKKTHLLEEQTQVERDEGGSWERMG